MVRAIFVITPKMEVNILLTNIVLLQFVEVIMYQLAGKNLIFFPKIVSAVIFGGMY